MPSSSKIVLFLLAALVQSGAAFADTTKIQQVVTLIGIDDKAQSPESKQAATGVEHLVELGLKSHPNVRASAARLDASRSSVDAAQGSYQPTLWISADANKVRTKNLQSDQFSKAESEEGAVNLKENLWRGGQDSGLVDLARQNEEIAAIEQLNTQEYLAYSIRKAALDFNYRSLRQVIEEASFRDASEVRSLAERKFGAGQVGKIDIHLASMRESAAKASAARNGIYAQQAEQNLYVALGPGVAPESVATELKALTQRSLPFPIETPTFGDAKIVSFTEKNSLAVQKKAEITLDQGYRGRFLPTIDFVGSYGRQNQSAWLEDLADKKDQQQTLSTTLSLQFSWVLWDRTQDYNNRAAAFQKTAATAQVEAARYQTTSQIQLLQRSILDFHKTLAISREAYVQAGQLYDSQRKLYESGVIALQALVDAEREKRLAIATWQDTVYELQLNLLRWDALQKGLLADAPSLGSN